ncbi:50S ribosomal protein L6 [Candidatus Wolfebacteria bacterium]|nr:MAG: 50S ribosomal protein L6 [Candidatus Wolfebacteria bacterium]
MSRIGKKEITVPEKVTLQKNDNGVLVVKGPLGELSRDFSKGNVDVVVEDNKVSVVPQDNSVLSRALWGTYASHIRNMIEGVNTGFEKKLEIEGVGYKWAMKGKDIELSVGFSHTVIKIIPEGLTILIEKNGMSVKGIDKELVGSFAADVRAIKKPEPYKGKGIRYKGEVIRRKQGKKAV